MSNIEYLPLFPHLVTRTDTNPEFLEFRDKFIDYAYNLRTNCSGITRSNKNGWHSDVKIKNDDDFQDCMGFLKKYIGKAVSTLFKSGTKVTVESCWLNINGQNSMNLSHTHPGCNLSGCLWIKRTRKSGCLKAHNPNEFNHFSLFEAYSEEIKNQFNCDLSFIFKPIEGHMVIFPSDLRHSVLENDDPYDRVSLAFNLDVRPPPYNDKNSDQ
tara:strand:+ start:1134 stop:1769 length:636 start_codon:yes stop_codon:yes gene_type:complete